LGKNRIGFKLGTVLFGSGSECQFRFTSGRVTTDRVWMDRGHFGCASFQFMLQFGFRSVMDQFTSSVQVQISSSHFGC